MAAKHPSQLGHTLLAFEETDVRDRAEKFRFFGDDVVRRGAGGDRREMRDTNDLSVLPEPAHLVADGIGRFAADVGVHLIEDEHGNVVLGGEHGFQCQHDASDFA